MHGNRKTATCEICQTVLFSNYHLKRHMLTHTGERRKFTYKFKN